MAPTHPEILYAQRSSADEAEKNVIYLTIQAPDIQGEPTLNIEAKKVSFQAKTGDASKGVPEKDLACDLELFDEIDPSFTKKTVTSRAIVLVLRKKEAKAEYWPRLTKEKPNKNWIKTDFSKWVDEDEQEDAPVEDEGMGGGMPPGMDMASMMGGGAGGMPGMGGMGGMPGMGGAGGPGGMDFASMMGGMGGAGGAGGAGGMDFAKLMEQMKANGGPGMEGDDFDDEEADEADEAEAEGAAAASSSQIEDLDKPE